ncbi:hypothetical protein L1987_48527 [Smallanthus sonchifolius]|uniref:Uncharacterized protein n=1 Tax=Smallanthus sonchifolius TaxID=185202 RepID=A0ACB9FS10_9ASTR|nr:hypothetical protein L1987_48527 [Smallanthus sonchifolius]
MKKNHSRSIFSGTETPLFPELLGFSDVESGAESISLGFSSSNTDSDADDNNDNGHNGEVITLQTRNESLQKAVAKLTSLVSSLSTTVQSQEKEILKLNKENKIEIG